MTVIVVSIFSNSIERVLTGQQAYTEHTEQTETHRDKLTNLDYMVLGATCTFFFFSFWYISVIGIAMLLKGYHTHRHKLSCHTIRCAAFFSALHCFLSVFHSAIGIGLARRLLFSCWLVYFLFLYAIVRDT